MVYELVDKNDPILKTPTELFNFDNPPLDPQELFENLKETLIETKGIGLAANQVGLPYRVLVAGHHSQPDEIAVLFNPRIVDYSGEQQYGEEACLSFPGIFMKVKRFDTIRVRYQLEDGQTDTKALDGFSARIIQHEVDHLDGLTFFDRANRYHREQAINQKRKLERRMKKNARR